MLSKLSLLLPCLLIGCATTIHRTPCGVYVNETPGMDLDALDRHESVAVKSIGRGCGDLARYTLIVHEGSDDVGAWTDQWDRRVAGLTYCDTHAIEIGTADWLKSAYAHEIIHAGFECPYNNVDHLGWDDNYGPEGLNNYERIDRARDPKNNK